MALFERHVMCTVLQDSCGQVQIDAAPSPDGYEDPLQQDQLGAKH